MYVLPEADLYKVRLFGALFMWRAYALSNHRKQKVSEMMNVATEVAIKPLLYDSSIQFSRDEAKTIASSYLPSTIEAMEVAYRAGPTHTVSCFKRARTTRRSPT